MALNVAVGTSGHPVLVVLCLEALYPAAERYVAGRPTVPRVVAQRAFLFCMTPISSVDHHDTD